MSGPRKAGRKEVRQEELRRLMKEKQQQKKKQQSSQERRVQSPFARYSGHAEELSCCLCRVRVRSELLWPAHVLGKQHKEKVSELKAGGGGGGGGKDPQGRRTEEEKEEEGGAREKQGPSQETVRKRRTPEEEEEEKEVTVKRARGAVQSEASQKSAGLSLLAGVYDDDDDDEEEEVKGGAAPPSSGLPADFFDSALPSSVSHSGSIQKPEASSTAAPPPSGQERSSNTAEALPEGFFDDPVRDAKVRNVEAPQEQMEKEWEEFQKEIRQVNTKSEAIVAEEDEEGRLERQIEEIDQQIECYRRVEVLRDRRDEARSKTTSRQQQQEEEELEEDEEELLGLLSRDWRAKGALA